MSEDIRMPARLPDNWRRIILDHVHNIRPFCPRALYADLRDTPPVYDPPSQRHGAERPYVARLSKGRRFIVPQNIGGVADCCGRLSRPICD